jgi:hypothetical protein
MGMASEDLVSYLGAITRFVRVGCTHPHGLVVRSARCIRAELVHLPAFHASVPRTIMRTECHRREPGYAQEPY